MISVPPRSKRFCKNCQVDCNRNETFFHYISPHAHWIRVENKKRPPRCISFNETFESQGQIQRHLNRAAHQKVLINQNKSFFIELKSNQFGYKIFPFFSTYINKTKIKQNRNRKELEDLEYFVLKSLSLVPETVSDIY